MCARSTTHIQYTQYVQHIRVCVCVPVTTTAPFQYSRGVRNYTRRRRRGARVHQRRLHAVRETLSRDRPAGIR